MWSKIKVASLARSRGAGKRKRDYRGLTAEHLEQLMAKNDGCCAISGLKLVMRSGNNTHPLNASVDRINEKDGYRDGNVRIIAHCINSFRMHMTDAEMFDVAQAIVRRNCV